MKVRKSINLSALQTVRTNSKLNCDLLVRKEKKVSICSSVLFRLLNQVSKAN
jgi:hypothetical protein